jgi:hypothetical protein
MAVIKAWYAAPPATDGMNSNQCICSMDMEYGIFPSKRLNKDS